MPPLDEHQQFTATLKPQRLSATFAAGVPGPPGPQGPPGEDGADSTVPGPEGPPGPAGIPLLVNGEEIGDASSGGMPALIVQDEGVARPFEPALNFTGAGVSVADDAANNRTNVAIGGAGIIGCVIDGGGSAPATGTKAVVQCPYAGTITGWTLLADASGSAQVTVKKATYAGYPTTSSIVASAPLTVSSAVKATSTTLTGWTTSFAAGDVFEFVLDSAAALTRLTVELLVTKA